MCPRLQDVTVFAVLAERRLAPTLFVSYAQWVQKTAAGSPGIGRPGGVRYGVFPEGRIEGFIEGKSLVTAQLSDADRSAAIAAKLATFHGEILPLRKTSEWCTRTLRVCVGDFAVSMLLGVYLTRRPARMASGVACLPRHNRRGQRRRPWTPGAPRAFSAVTLTPRWPKWQPCLR